MNSDMDSESFKFIGDADFRRSIEADAKELKSALAVEAWKAAHVLAGSIIEAVLVEYLQVLGYTKREPLRMTLPEAIAAGLELGFLSKRVEGLANVVREYRNLIHPGRVVRLGEQADARGARIALELVHIIAAEVAKHRAATYGYTAEQLIEMLERNPSALSYTSHLLAKTKVRELERLVTLIPARHRELETGLDQPNDILRSLEAAFVLLLDGTSEQTVAQLAAQQFVRILKEEPEGAVESYTRGFVRASDLSVLPDEDKHMAFDFLKAQLTDRTSLLPKCFRGLSLLVQTPESIRTLAIRLARLTLFAHSSDPRDWRDLTMDEFMAFPEDLREEATKGLDYLAATARLDEERREQFDTLRACAASGAPF